LYLSIVHEINLKEAISMAQLVVRNLPDQVKDMLQLRAKAHGRSFEAEVRDSLTLASKMPPQSEKPPKQGVGTWLAERSRANPIPDDVWTEFEESLNRVCRSARARPVDLSE
jgi:plasmid stability protein